MTFLTNSSWEIPRHLALALLSMNIETLGVSRIDKKASIPMDFGIKDIIKDLNIALSNSGDYSKFIREFHVIFSQFIEDESYPDSQKNFWIQATKVNEKNENIIEIHFAGAIFQIHLLPETEFDEKFENVDINSLKERYMNWVN